MPEEVSSMLNCLNIRGYPASWAIHAGPDQFRLELVWNKGTDSSSAAEPMVATSKDIAGPVPCQEPQGCKHKKKKTPCKKKRDRDRRRQFRKMKKQERNEKTTARPSLPPEVVETSSRHSADVDGSGSDLDGSGSDLDGSDSDLDGSDSSGDYNPRTPEYSPAWSAAEEENSECEETVYDDFRRDIKQRMEELERNFSGDI